MDRIEEMNKMDNGRLKARLEKPIEDLEISVEAYSRLKRAKIKTIFDIIQLENLKDIDRFTNKDSDELYMQLLKYGIDFNDKEQCKNLQKKYKKYKLMEENNSIEKILNLTVEDFDLDAKMFNVLKRAGINTAYDVVERENIRSIRNFGTKRFEELKQKFIGYGIDLEDRAQCEELIKKYDNITNNQEDKRITAWEQQLELEKSNDILEEKLEAKQDTLLGLKQQLERRKYLEQKLIECDKEFKRLMKLYNSLNSKESSNNHGTK